MNAYALPRDMEVTCGVHGPMKWREGPMWWVCPGFDGEGCCEISAETVYTLGSGIPLPEESHLLPIYYERNMYGLFRLMVKGPVSNVDLARAWGFEKAPSGEV